jgi:hypothetical protein
MNMRFCATLSAFMIGASVAHTQDATWETVSIPEICTYQIPPTVEIQKGAYKKIKDQLGKIIFEIEPSSNRVVAQPKGINDFDPAALKRYCRIIVSTLRGTRGDYLKIDEPFALSAAELKELDNGIQESAQQEVALSTAKGIMRITLLSWQPVKIVRVNGVNALLWTYSRSMNDAPAVLVRGYWIQNSDCFHNITISYRENESNLWAEDLGKVIGTFKFKKR